MTDSDRPELLKLLKRWERLSLDLKPQTQGALIEMIELQRETGRLLSGPKAASEPELEPEPAA